MKSIFASILNCYSLLAYSLKNDKNQLDLGKMKYAALFAVMFSLKRMIVDSCEIVYVFKQVSNLYWFQTIKKNLISPSF